MKPHSGKSENKPRKRSCKCSHHIIDMIDNQCIVSCVGTCLWVRSEMLMKQLAETFLYVVMVTYDYHSRALVTRIDGDFSFFNNASSDLPSHLAIFCDSNEWIFSNLKSNSFIMKKSKNIIVKIYPTFRPYLFIL